jgi:hypothetical protein
MIWFCLKDTDLLEPCSDCCIEQAWKDKLKAMTVRMLLDLFVDKAERLGVETEYIDPPTKHLS